MSIATKPPVALDQAILSPDRYLVHQSSVHHAMIRRDFFSVSLIVVPGSCVLLISYYLSICARRVAEHMDLCPRYSIRTVDRLALHCRALLSGNRGKRCNRYLLIKRETTQ